MSLKKKMEPQPQSLLYSAQSVLLSLDPRNTHHGLVTECPTDHTCWDLVTAGEREGHLDCMLVQQDSVGGPFHKAEGEMEARRSLSKIYS